jgi:hypothetical protein
MDVGRSWRMWAELLQSILLARQLLLAVPGDIQVSFAASGLLSNPSPIDVIVDDCQLVLLDFKALMGVQPKCPNCGENTTLGANGRPKSCIESLGMPDNARMAKGDGETRTLYILAKRRQCLLCKGTLCLTLAYPVAEQR